MKRRGYQKYMERKKKLSGMRIVGIDPASQKHQAIVLDGGGMQIGRYFSFPVGFEGYQTRPWNELARLLVYYDPDNLVFAIECSCALWKSLAGYITNNSISKSRRYHCLLHHRLLRRTIIVRLCRLFLAALILKWNKGYTVLPVSPLTTYHTRTVMNYYFSKTDPKDALIIATNAKGGSYHEYRKFTADTNKLHRSSITCEKLVKDRQVAAGRLRALMEKIFPEYLSCIGIYTHGSLYLLERYFLPGHFQNMDVHEEEKNLWHVSNGNHSADMLMKLKALAQKSIGSRVKE